MTKYLAVAKPRGCDRPFKMEFSAANVTFALTEMTKLAGVKSTTDLECFELNEINEDGTMTLRADKEPSKTKTRVVLPATTPPQVIVQDTGEREYTGYEIEEA
jgi:hypothetical protein